MQRGEKERTSGTCNSLVNGGRIQKEKGPRLTIAAMQGGKEEKGKIRGKDPYFLGGGKKSTSLCRAEDENRRISAGSGFSPEEKRKNRKSSHFHLTTGKGRACPPSLREKGGEKGDGLAPKEIITDRS